MPPNAEQTLFPPYRRLDFRHVDLAHVHHGGEGALGFFTALAHDIGQDGWGDLPRHAPLVLAPAAGAFLAAVANDGIPVPVGFGLVAGWNDKGESFALLKHRPTVKSHA